MLRKNLVFFIPYIIFIIISSLLLIFFPKDEIHIFINRHYSNFFDIFFKVFTTLGNGWFIAALTLVLLFYRYRLALLVGISGIISGLIVQLLKRFVFEDVLRPVSHFNGVYDLHLINGVHNLSYYSFPSGHSASAFSAFLALALTTDNQLLKFIYFLIAMLVAYSRMYLSQHFLEDVFAGAIIGILITVPVYLFLYYKSNNRLDNSILGKAY